MNEPKFTKGPWEFDDAEHAFCRPAIIAKGAERYSTYGPVCLVMKRHPNYKANAKLIKAAPDMYKLIKSLAHSPDLSEWWTIHHTEMIALIDEIEGKETAK